MQQTTPNHTPPPKSVVKSVRFRTDQWERIQEVIEARGVPVGKFLANAVLVAAGVGSEAEEFRRLADALEATKPKKVASKKAGK